MLNERFQAIVKNQTRPRVSGHLILVESEQDAIRIQAKYKIGNPMGGQTELRSVKLATERQINNAKNGLCSIWYESGGKLKRA